MTCCLSPSCNSLFFQFLPIFFSSISILHFELNFFNSLIISRNGFLLLFAHGIFHISSCNFGIPFSLYALDPWTTFLIRLLRVVTHLPENGIPLLKYLQVFLSILVLTLSPQRMGIPYHTSSSLTHRVYSTQIIQLLLIDFFKINICLMQMG